VLAGTRLRAIIGADHLQEAGPLGYGGIVTGLSGRYATALFEAARDANALAAVGASLDRLAAARRESPDLAEVIASPIIDRAGAGRAIAAVADSLELDKLTRNFLGVLAANRRLSALPAIISGFTRLAADHRGETTAAVTAAHPLSSEQQGALKDKLKAHLRRDVHIDMTVDPAILGGLIVQIGSRRIDASIRSKLAAIGAAMKG